MSGDHIKVLTPVAAIERGIDVHPGDVLIGVMNPNSGELEPSAHGFASIEQLQAFIAEHEPDLVTVEGSGEDVSALRRTLLGPGPASTLH